MRLYIDKVAGESLAARSILGRALDIIGCAVGILLRFCLPLSGRWTRPTVLDAWLKRSRVPEEHKKTSLARKLNPVIPLCSRFI